MFGIIAGLLSSFIVVFISPSRKILLWALLFPLFDHLEILKIGELIPAVTFGRVFISALILAYLLKSKPENRMYPPNYGAVGRAMMIFAVVFTLEIYLKNRPKDGTRFFISFFESFLMPFLLYAFAQYYFNSYKSAERLFGILLATGLWVSLSGLFEQITHIDLVQYIPVGYAESLTTGLRGAEGTIRSNGPFMTPEAYGGTLSMIWFVALYRLRTAANDPRKRMALFFALILILAGVVACMFRSIWLGLIIGFLVHLYITPNRGRRGARWLLAGTLLFSILIVASKETGLLADFLQGRLFHKESMYSRFGAYGIAWRAFRGNLLSGIGYGRFQYYASHINAEHQVTFRGIWAANQAHNMLLSILAENGVMGVLPFFILAVAVVKSISRLRKQASSWLAREWTASMVGISIAYYIPWLFSTSGYYKALNCLFYLLLGITTKVASWEKDDEEVVLVGSANTFTQKAEDSL